jgi:predicted NBD/HSP70 family sugar kinase
VLDPSLIVLGGALVTRGESFLQEIRRVLKRVVPRPPAVVVSQLGGEAALWGCLLEATNLARTRLKQELGLPRSVA